MNDATKRMIGLIDREIVALAEQIEVLKSDKLELQRRVSQVATGPVTRLRRGTIKKFLKEKLSQSDTGLTLDELYDLAYQQNTGIRRKSIRTSLERGQNQTYVRTGDRWRLILTQEMMTLGNPDELQPDESGRMEMKYGQP